MCVCVLESLINQLNQESPNAAAAAGVCHAAVDADGAASSAAALLLLAAPALSAVCRTIQSVGATETRRLFV